MKKVQTECYLDVNRYFVVGSASVQRWVDSLDVVCRTVHLDSSWMPGRVEESGAEEKEDEDEERDDGDRKQEGGTEKEMKLEDGSFPASCTETEEERPHKRKPLDEEDGPLELSSRDSDGQGAMAEDQGAMAEDVFQRLGLPSSFGKQRKQRKCAQAASVARSARQVPAYWRARYHLFSRYDAGVRMDREAWYSVTPEAIAERIASRLVHSARGGGRIKGIVLDPFCGAGGNAIQLALAGAWVLAGDVLESRLHMTWHNASIYGVQNYIEYVQGDAADLLSTMVQRAPACVDAVFLSPPWGGPHYSREDLRLSDLPVDVMALVRQCLQGFPHAILAVYLPRSTCQSDLDSLAQLAYEHRPTAHPPEKEEYIVEGKPKAFTFYIFRSPF